MQKGLTIVCVYGIIEKVKKSVNAKALREQSRRGIVMQLEKETILEVCNRFMIAGEFLSYEVLNSGHINSTYRVYFLRDGEKKDYIVQKVNTYVFRDPIAVMDNIALVTEYIRAKIKQKQTSAKRNVLHYSTTSAGQY